MLIIYNDVFLIFILWTYSLNMQLIGVIVICFRLNNIKLYEICLKLYELMILYNLLTIYSLANGALNI